MNESEQIKTTEDSQSIKKFVFPSADIKQATEDLMIYWQLSNQKSIELYKKWEKPKTIKGVTYFFKGTLGESSLLYEFRDMIDLSFGKPWQTLIQSILLTENATEDVRLEGFHKLSQEQQIEVMKIISQGQKAKEILVEWLKPINTKNTFDAIYDAAKVKIGNDRYDKFRILKVDSVKSISNPDESVSIFPELLEVDNSAALAEYLRTKENLPDCLIITFMRNKKFDFKASIYMFLVWKNVLYVIDFSEQRANLENTAGARNPSKYFERQFENVWLPFDKILSNKKNSKENTIQLRTQKVFKRGNMIEILSKKPEQASWLEIFVYRVIDWIKNTVNIPKAFSVHEQLKMLPDKSQALQERVRSVYDDENDSSFESQNDASSYLIRKYGSDVKDIIPVTTKLPDILGTKQYIDSVILYKQRDEVAKTIEKIMWQDYNKNCKRVYKQIRDFVLSKNVSGIVKKGLLDNAYPRMMFFTDFGSESDMVYVEGKKVKLDKVKTMNEKILEIIDYPKDLQEFRKRKRQAKLTRERYYGGMEFWNTFPRYFSYDEDDLEIIFTPDRKFFYGNDSVPVQCAMCKNEPWRILISLKFKDYHQFFAFFECEKDNNLPKEMQEHFHWQNESYVGNSILDDTDPVDEIKDPWFRRIYEKDFWKPSDGRKQYVNGEPYLNVRIPVCRKCYKESNSKEVKKNDKK